MARAAVESLIPAEKSRWDELIDVFAFVPTIEVIFFEAPGALELILGDSVREATLQERLLTPVKTLRTLFSSNNATLKMSSIFEHLNDAKVASLISQGKQASALKETVKSMFTQPV